MNVHAKNMLVAIENARKFMKLHPTFIIREGARGYVDFECLYGNMRNSMIANFGSHCSKLIPEDCPLCEKKNG